MCVLIERRLAGMLHMEWKMCTVMCRFCRIVIKSIDRGNRNTVSALVVVTGKALYKKQLVYRKANDRQGNPVEYFNACTWCFT